MPCKSCEERRRIAVDAYKAGDVKAVVKAVVKAAPKIASHLIRNRPTIVRKEKP